MLCIDPRNPILLYIAPLPLGGCCTLLEECSRFMEQNIVHEIASEKMNLHNFFDEKVEEKYFHFSV